MRLLLTLLPILACSALDLPIPLPTGLPDIEIPDIPLPEIIDDLNPAKIGELFEEFVKSFGKEYANPEEQAKALASFGENLKSIIQLNLDHKEDLVKFGINQYSDLTDTEFGERVLMREPFNLGPTGNGSSSASTRAKRAAPPAAFDWRTKPNVVSGIKNQGSCGCCWGFAAAAVITGVNGIKTGKLVEPSEQQLCDCSGKRGTAGCNGGYVGYGLQYARDNGVSAETGYTAYSQTRATRSDKCDDKGKANNIHVKDYDSIYPSDATKIRDNLIVKGPIAVGFAVGQSFRHYKSGVFNNNDCTKKETFVGYHAVTVVGYGVDKNVPYWIIKNSWGPNWGEKGYINYVRGTDLCELETEQVYYAIA